MKSIPNISLYQGYTSTSGSLYTGPFAAGKFKVPSLSVSQGNNDNLAIAKSISPRSKNVISKPSEVATDRAQTEQDRLLESPPAPKVKIQRFRTLSDPKLGQISVSSRSSKVPTLPDKIDKENTKTSLPLGDYLKLLNLNSKSSDLNSFREKMSLSRSHFKSFGDISSLPYYANPQKVVTTLPDAKLSKRLRPTVPSIAFNLQSPSHSPTPTLSKIASPVLSPRRIISPKSLDESPAFLAKQASRRKLLTLIMDDNTQARELAEEIDKNYQLFEETASKSKELKLQLTLLLKKVGLIQAFETKNSKINPLVHRIYNDMLEEPESTKSPSLKMDYNQSPRRMLRTLSIPKFQTKGRLIKAKYEAYKTVNEVLEDMLLQYKLHNLKRLENTLLQAHENLVFKKKKILSQLEMNDYDTFCRVKKNFEQLGDVPAAYYSEHVEEVERLQLRYGENLKIDESQKIVNRGLGEILQKWTNKVQ